MHDKLTVAESWWSGPGNEFLSATVSLSSTNCGPRRHQSSSLYERPSERGQEWALKPPLQTLYGWRRNAAGLPQLVERPAFGGNRCNSGTSLEHDSPADPKMGAVAAVLVENGPRSSASMANAFARGN